LAAAGARFASTAETSAALPGSSVAFNLSMRGGCMPTTLLARYSAPLDTLEPTPSPARAPITPPTAATA
jgi:hypothetical protein